MGSSLQPRCEVFVSEKPYRITKPLGSRTVFLPNDVLCHGPHSILEILPFHQFRPKSHKAHCSHSVRGNAVWRLLILWSDPSSGIEVRAVMFLRKLGIKGCGDRGSTPFV